MRKLHSVVLASLLSVATLPALAQAHAAGSGKSVHAGNWWLSKSDTYRDAFMNGYKSGWHHSLGHDSPLSAFGANTVAEGVDKFYAKFENRLIAVDDAISYVDEQLNGVAPDKLNAEVLKLRAAAAKANTGPDTNE